MKKILSAVLCLCLLFCFAASAEEISGPSFLLKIHNVSSLEVSYLRLDVWLESEEGEEYTGFILSSPDEGKDFYGFPIDVDDPEYLKSMRFDLSYGISELSPEDAMLQVMMGNTGEEHPLLTLDFVPECGKVYNRALVSDGKDSWKLALYAGPDDVVPTPAPAAGETVPATRAYFEEADRSMQAEDLIAEIGQPDSITGSGFPTYEWELEDGGKAHVVFDTEGIASIVISAEGQGPENIWFR